MSQNGTIDMLASDHSPASPDMKLIEMGDFMASWGGIAGKSPPPFFFLPLISHSG